MDYRITQIGRTAEPIKPDSNSILEYMKAGHGVVNPEKVEEEVTLSEGRSSKEILERMVKAGYLSKTDEESEFGELDVMGPDPYAGI